MDAHLTDEQVAAALQDQADAASLAHLESCGACANELRALRGALAGFRGEVRAAAEGSEGLWISRREAVMVGLHPRRRAGLVPGLAWATGLGLALLAAVWLDRSQPPMPAVPARDPDHELLVEVERSLRRELPRALEPAVLLTIDLTRLAGAGR